MNLKQMMSDDLDIFYSSDEFGISAKFNGVDITVLNADDMEVSDSKMKVITAKVSDVAGIQDGDIITLETIDHKVFNFDYKDGSNIEYLIALEEV